MSADSEAGGYLLGARDPELARLALQHEIWRAPTGALLDAAGFGTGMRLADLGCGPGWTTLDLAARVVHPGPQPRSDGPRSTWRRASDRPAR